ncbi:protein twisted gastrulation-like [Arctopsyche grandis]|uniref:protein twisted gastrulation-like n=1 Tax=Arctopsyche grandis TaxID=121162 RepID=UPI00406D74B6
MFGLLRFVFLFLSFYDSACSAACNEAVCASVVSKCMLTQSCKCDLTHCSCCKDCYNCLSYLYKECCSCVDMCPGVDALSNQSKESYMELFHEGGVPQLFALLTSEPDPNKRWVSVPLADNDLSLQSIDGDINKQNSLAENCTLAYMSHCMPLTKCKSSCESLGSAGFRWFRDGCCECIGETCKNYGLDEKRYYCKEEGHAEEEIPEDNLNFGEDMDPQEESN